VEAVYNVLIPLDQYQPGTIRHWTSIIRVEPEKKAGPAVYLADSFGEGSANIIVGTGTRRSVLSYYGYFWTGKGKFTVDLMVLDGDGRRCKTRSVLSASDESGGLKLSLPDGGVSEMSVAGLVQDVSEQRFSSPDAARLTLLLDVTPRLGAVRRPGPFLPKSMEPLRVLAGLNGVVLRLPAASVRLICFSLDRQSVVYRDEDFHVESLDSLQRLEEAISKVNFDTADYSAVSNPQGRVALLRQLINAEIIASPPSAVVIFLGDQETFQDKLPSDDVRAGASPPSFFYLRPDRIELLHDDSVTLAVKAARGTTFGYSTPQDLERAIEHIKAAILPKRR
jgi:hypothetical protein